MESELVELGMVDWESTVGKAWVGLGGNAVWMQELGG